MEPLKTRVLVVGNKGRYGVWWTQVFELHGYNVRGFDQHETHSSKLGLVEWATVIVFAVPSSEVAKVIESVFDSFRADQLLINTASIQLPGFEAMNTTPCECVGLHILADVPVEFSLKRYYKVFVCLNERLVSFKSWVETILEEMECLNVWQTSFEEHDNLRNTGTILPRLCAFVHGAVLEEKLVDVEELVGLETAFGRMSHEILRRFLGQPDSLDAELLIDNEGSLKVIQCMIGKLRELEKLVAGRKREEIASAKKKIRVHLGSSFMNSIL